MSLAHALLFSLGLAAMAVPLWVHLRLGKVKKRAVVPTLRLMRATPQTSKSPRRLVDVPLLLLRLLLLLLVALGFGRVLIPLLASKDAVEHVVMILDVSGSMRAGKGKVWEQARDEALAALGKLNASSQVAVVRSPQSQTQPVWETPAEAIRRVREISPGYGANRLASAMLTADQLLAGMPADHPKVLCVISDFQRSAFVDIDRVSISSDVVLRVFKAGAETQGNRGISVKVASAAITDVGVYAFHDGSNGSLKFEENGRSGDLAITPGQDAARLTHSGKKTDWITRRLFLEEDDALADDNQAWDVYRTQESLPVWLWEPSDTKLRDYEKVSYFLGRALQPVLENGSAAVSRYSPVVLGADELASSTEKAGAPDAPRLLMVPACSELPPALVSLVRKLVDSGGSVLFFGGPGLNVPAYESAFGPLLGVKIGAPSKCQGSPALAPISSKNPLWGGLDASTRLQLAQAALRERHSLVAESGAQVLASYADGIPFVVENSAGKGRVFFVNTSSDRSWGDWPTSAPKFVPALHLLAARALGTAASTPANAPVSAGEPSTLQLPREFAGKSLKIGQELIPVDPEGRVKQAVFPEPGVVSLTLADGTDAGKIAVNFPTTESTLVSDTPAVVRQRLEALRRQDGKPSIRWESEDQGGLAWKLCLFGAALLLVIEPAVANHRKKLV